MNMTERLSVLAKHPLLNSIVSALIGAAATIVAVFISNNVMIHNYITFDSTSGLIQSYLIGAGYVDEAILQEGSIDKQFAMLQSSFDNYSTAIESSLENLGLSSESISEMSKVEMLDRLPSLALLVYNSNQNNSNKVESLTSDNVALTEENERLKTQKTVELMDANLIIDGELMNSGDPINYSVALIEGNAYYSQSLLNTYVLSEMLKYDTTENAAIVGNQKPEKVKLSWDSMVSDPHGVDVYRLGSGNTFSMGMTSYGEGIVLSAEDCFYVHLRNEYSKLSFTYGHVDNTSQGNLELSILAMDENGETYTTTLKTITLVGEMEPKNIEIPLSYASAIKIVVSNGDYSARYGLSNIYLYT